MTPAEEMRLQYAERRAERQKLKLIDIRDRLRAATDPHSLTSVLMLIPDEIDAFLAEEVCPGEGPVDKCPDCGEPWWTVQKRCKCWPKHEQGRVDAEVSDE